MTEREAFNDFLNRCQNHCGSNLVIGNYVSHFYDEERQDYLVKTTVPGREIQVSRYLIDSIQRGTKIDKARLKDELSDAVNL